MRETFGSATRGTALILTFCGMLLISGNGFAQGGTCPAAANYVNPSTSGLVTLSSLGITSCYYVAASGSDSNAGTSEAAPWLHAPFMPNCTGNCATVTKQSASLWPGIGIIFRGGDTWHFGNSGATPYTGGMWEWNTGTVPHGTASNPIYVGVDQSWYSGASWTRPIFTGDNPVCGPGSVGGNCTYNSNGWCYGSSPACTGLYYVSSCPYQIGSSNDILEMTWVSYFIVDNFEMTGICESNPGQLSHQNTYVSYGSAQGPDSFQNLYIHGWSHLAFAGNNGGPNCTASTVCFDSYAFYGTSQTSTGETINHVVVDGSDSDPIGLGWCDCGAWNTEFSYFGYTSQTICSTHAFHDNLYEYFYENGHSNLLEEVAGQSGTNAVYNNVFRHIESGCSSGCGVGIWLDPPVGSTDYYFNNVMYDEGDMELFNAGQNGSNQGTMDIFNNTFEFSVTGVGISCSARGNSGPVNSTNNHFITESSAFSSNCSSAPVTETTDLTMNHSKATSDGYTSSETYAYSPTSGSSPTVAAGTNKNSAYCSALSAAAGSDPYLSDASNACLSDTRYACTYNTSNHTVTCPARTSVARPTSAAWDIGAYQDPAGSTPPQPPTNVQATAH